MKTLLTILSKINLLNKVTKPGVSQAIIINRKCSCGGHCKCHNK